MEISSNWAKKGVLIATAITAVFIMSGYGVASVEKIWTEKTTRTNQDISPVGGTLFRGLAEKLSPAVVNVKPMKKITKAYGNFPYSNSPYGMPRMTPPQMKPHGPKEFRQKGEGSGFIIHKEGYILTNAHVIESSDSVQIALSTGGLFKGKVIGMDRVADLALIKIDSPDPLPVIPLGYSEELKPGDWVMAIGSPFGLDLTVTVGIVSAKGRSLGATPYDDFIQTDTPINPGNSGGPLINTNGEVVGINTAVMQMGQGLGFSLPVDLAKKLIPELKANGKVTRSWLGVSVQDISLADKESLKLGVDQGSLVREVVVDSPAYKAGLKMNDVIVEFDGHTINSSRNLPKEVVYTPAGKEISIKLVREGKNITVEAILQPFPEGMMS
ncbi:MAG: trypsin-like serine protease [Nitrospina sp.]|jgi:serine protease Do|nr:trypsin-like serine protease [Nitrospina sp.]MBT7754401.1 trypsin-like serine protease [Gammaproteobacteria bacterium]